MKVLLLNQCFWPDVVSTAQHLTDLAVELADQGHDVTVVAGNRGYDDRSQRFPRRENRRGVKIVRIPVLNLGKRSKWRRAAGFGSYLISCTLKLLFLPKFDAVIALTSPPLISFLGALFVKVKRGKFFFWVMDLNPDEAIAAGWFKETSITARALGRFLRYSLRHADRVIVLDRFMKDRILSKGIAADKIDVLAPWSHNDAVQFDAKGRDEFRRRHDLAGKFVVMYSGNHSPCHPLDTLLAAAQKLNDQPDLAFCFVGGGSEHDKVRAFAQAHRLSNIQCLPYQPLDALSGSLSAADLHTVVMGERFVGIVHPCKIYNILEVGAPLLYIGPAKSHVEDLIAGFGEGTRAWTARHGEVDVVVRSIEAARKMGHTRARVEQALLSRFSKGTLLPEMLKIVVAPVDGEPSADRLVAHAETLSAHQ